MVFKILFKLLWFLDIIWSCITAFLIQKWYLLILINDICSKYQIDNLSWPETVIWSIIISYLLTELSKYMSNCLVCLPNIWSYLWFTWQSRLIHLIMKTYSPITTKNIHYFKQHSLHQIYLFITKISTFIHHKYPPLNEQTLISEENDN